MSNFCTLKVCAWPMPGAPKLAATRRARATRKRLVIQASLLMAKRLPLRNPQVRANVQDADYSAHFRTENEVRAGGVAEAGRKWPARRTATSTCRYTASNSRG